MKRRDFFKLSMPMLSSPFLLNSTLASTFTNFNLLSTIDCDMVRDRFLVIVQLKGANDGLNTIIRPEFDAEYSMKRANIKIDPSQLLMSSESIFDEIRFHPSMGAIRDLANDGALNVIQSVGYPTMNRSHFKATDLWLTGGDGNNQSLSEGWMGKYLEYVFDGYNGTPTPFMPDPLGIHLKSKTPSLGFHTQTPPGHLKAINLSVKDGDHYTVSSDYGTSNQFFENLNCSNRADYMKQLDLEASAYGQRVLDKYAHGTNSAVDYGNYDLGAQLKTVARLVNGGSRTKIFLTEMTGFDTHVSQLVPHAGLLDHLSNSIGNFMEDLENLGILDRCLIVTFSEFGRKFQSNSSGLGGTDHGTLAPMMVFGAPGNINAGVSGPKLDVTTIDNQGAPVVTPTNNVDYREVFISIMRQWLGANKGALDNAFGVYSGPGDELDLIQAPVDASPNAETPLCYTTDAEYEHEFTVVIPVLPPGPGQTDPPLVEITACDYVDLKPGFHAPYGSNVHIYPLECPPDAVYPVECPPPTVVGNNMMAVFSPDMLENIETNKVLYTRVEERGEAIALVEKVEEEEKVKINVFPNPTSDYLMVRFNLREGEKQVRLDILDTSARIMPVRIPAMQQSSTMYEVQINVSDLSSGTYYLRYQSEKMVETFKFVKI